MVPWQNICRKSASSLALFCCYQLADRGVIVSYDCSGKPKVLQVGLGALGGFGAFAVFVELVGAVQLLG